MKESPGSDTIKEIYQFGVLAKFLNSKGFRQCVSFTKL